ncbi:MAG TPA: nuclear transport factor 2 family protein [Candidatus Binataceae bacterium]|nr:nuclear transport factor 2 family protein [Candidatus Binataceae bacterium]
MIKRILMSLALALILSAPAFAKTRDAKANEAAKQSSDAFIKACTAGDLNGVAALYADGADVIWPGQGEAASGKDSIEKLAAKYCKPGNGPLSVRFQDAWPIGREYISVVSGWDENIKGDDGKPVKMDIRATELLHKVKGKWLIVLDHASVGMMPPPAPCPTPAQAPATSAANPAPAQH